MVTLVANREESTRDGRRARHDRGLKYDVVLTHPYLLSLTRLERKMLKPFAPLGPLYVAAFLRQSGHKVKFYDPTFEKNVTGFRETLRQYRPSLVGIHVLETTRHAAVEMIRYCRSAGTTVAVGGPDPSVDPDFYIRNGADLVVVGEGEETMDEIMAAIKSGARTLAGIPGVYSPRGFAGPRKPAAALDTLPFPARDLVHYSPYFDVWRRTHGVAAMQMSISRGGAYGGSVSSAARRSRSVPGVVEEMLFVKMIYRPDRLWFTDDLAGVGREWIALFREEVVRKRAAIPFTCSLRVDAVDRDILAELKTAGCIGLWFDIGSGSPAVLEHLRTKFGVEEIRRTVRLAKEAGIGAGVGITIGYPFETIDDFEHTRALLRETRPDECSISIAYPQKGSRFYREVESRLSPVRFSPRYEEDNIITFRSRYSQNFYDIVRNLLREEWYVASHPGAGALERVKHRLYQWGYGIMKHGIT